MAYDFLGYFAIPFLTVALSRETPLFSTNFSSIRTASRRQGEFLVWSLLLLSYLFLCLLPFLRRAASPAKEKGSEADGEKTAAAPGRPRLLLPLFLGCAALLLTAVFTPYLPREKPFLSQIHVYASVWSSVSFLALLFSAVLSLCRESRTEGRLLFFLLTAAASFCLSSYIVTGIVNSAMEIVYTLACCVTANRLRLFFSRPCRGREPAA